MNVRLEHLTKVFPGRDKKNTQVVAVSDFDFSIPDGLLIGLLGPSGCGKSTLLYMICGLENPSSGKVYFGEDDVTGIPAEERGVGLVFQNYALYPHLTVRQNITFPLENLTGEAKLTKAERMDKALQVAKLVQIEDLLDRKPGEMSGGQQQRVAIARALVKMPKVLLMDEPLSNLDARLRLQTREEIRRIQKATGITTIFVTHDQEEAMSISDLIVVMRDGVFQQMDKPQTVYDDPVNLFVARFLGTPAINVFEGHIEHSKLYIGDEAVMDRVSARDGKVYVGVRPEGLVPDSSGDLSMKLVGIEVMGRDTSVVSTHPDMTGVNVRAIISAENVIDRDSGTVRFNLKRGKTLIFDKETEARIFYD